MKDVTVEISTKDRYEMLQHCLLSVAQQTYIPKEVLIFDDGLCKDLRSNAIFSNIFGIMNRRGIKWRVFVGQKKGQVANHQEAIHEAESEWIWRIDDDNVAEFDTLEKLMKHTDDDKVGAVAGSVLHAACEFPQATTSGKIADIYFKYPAQFTSFDDVMEVEHLYSTFVFRKSATKGYPNYLSKIGHREESILSHEMYRAGYKLLVDGRATTWHFHHPTGGIRGWADSQMWKNDEIQFEKKMREWGVSPTQYKLIILDNGIGDHFIFKSILPEVKAKYKNIIIATCYPFVFEDEKDVTITSIHGGFILSRGERDAYNVYKFCTDNKWNKPITEAFRKFYL